MCVCVAVCWAPRSRLLIERECAVNRVAVATVKHRERNTWACWSTASECVCLCALIKNLVIGEEVFILM